MWGIFEHMIQRLPSHLTGGPLDLQTVWMSMILLVCFMQWALVSGDGFEGKGLVKFRLSSGWGVAMMDGASAGAVLATLDPPLVEFAGSTVAR